MKFLSGKNSGFFMMVLAVLGVVLYVTLFNNILTAFVTLSGVSNAASYIAFSTVVSIAPTILFLAGIFGAGFLYYKGYKSAQGAGVNSLMMIVLGCLEIILFITLFSTIMESMETIRTNANIDDFIALETVVQIAPTILLLAGVFAGVMTGVSGVRNRKSKGMLA